MNKKFAYFVSILSFVFTFFAEVHPQDNNFNNKLDSNSNFQLQNVILHEIEKAIELSDVSIYCKVF